jgi:NADH:ubiquinone oxidoreductase subunit 4 (subunit M)
MVKNEKKYPKGYWMGVGISIGIALGAAYLLWLFQRTMIGDLKESTPG